VNESGGRCSNWEREKKNVPLGKFLWFSIATSGGPLRISKNSIKDGQFIEHPSPL
jgi:hypothetical protein